MTGAGLEPRRRWVRRCARRRRRTSRSAVREPYLLECPQCGAESAGAQRLSEGVHVNPRAKGSVCLACQRASDEVPLLGLEYRGGKYWICPQHLPVLIHDPAQLVDKIPGAESFRPSEHHDD